MRALTKTGIRILSAKYRSILIKCAIINASMFIGVFGAGSAMAEDMTWSQLKNNIDNAASGVTITIPNSITSDDYDYDGISIEKNITLQGNNDIFLSGDDTYYGLTVGLNKIVTLQDITMKKFTGDIGAIDNYGTLNLKATYSDIVFNGNSVPDGFGGAICNGVQGTIALYANPDRSITFIDNTAQNGGAIYNGGNITTIASNFSTNSANEGGAIENKGTISSITGDFESNIATTEGGAIYNYAFKSSGNEQLTATINNITGDFTSNTAKNGGAIANKSKNNQFGSESNAIINKITGKFISNHADTSGGAIHNTNSGVGAKIENIEGTFTSNTAKNGGAINNEGNSIIGSIAADFESNSATQVGGAIRNFGEITNITGNFTNNFAANGGGAVMNNGTANLKATDRDITFEGNYKTVSNGMGGAILNMSTIGLYADAGHSITFVGGEDVIDTEHPENNKYDIDGIYNTGILNINGNETDTYTGTVNLYNVSDADTPTGTTNIYGGNVNVKDTFAQKDLNLNAGTLNLGKGGTVTNLNANGGALSMSIPYGTFDNYTNEISTLTVDKFTGTLNNFTVDFNPGSSNDPLACMDKISINAIEGTPAIHLTAVNVLGNSELPPPPVTATYLTGGGKDSILTTETGNIKTAIDGYTYTFTFDGAGKGNVLVTMNADEQMSLPAAIADETITGYSAQVNPVIIYGDLGTLAGENRIFTIFGNGSTIDGNGNAGITVEEGQTLTLNNADMKNFNGLSSAIDNSGITNVISQNSGSITFSNNIGMTGGAINSTASSTEGENSRPLHIEAKGGNINFTKNSAAIFGGGLVVAGSADLIADNGQIVFDENTAPTGGAIAIQSSTELDKLDIVAMNNDIIFKNNTATGDPFIVNGGGAIFVQSGQVDIIAKNGKIEFQNNSTTGFEDATGFGGAILAVDFGGEIQNDINIVAENNDIIFSGNTADFGGAIANIGELNIKAQAGHTVEFTTATDSIANVSALGKNSILTINDADNGYTGDVILQDVVSADLDGLDDTATPGDMVIGGGRVIAKGNIEQSNITVKSGATLASNIDNVEIIADGTDGNLINDGTINITGANSRFGADHLTNNATINITGANSLLETSTLTNNGTIDTVNLVSESLNNNGNITTSGGIEAIIQNNEGGSITFNGDAEKQMELTNSGTVNFNGGLSETGSIIRLTQNDGVMNFSTVAINSTINHSIDNFTMNGGTVNIADGSINTLHINQLTLSGNTNFAIDADLADDGQMDQLNVTSVSGSGNIVISDIKLLSDTNDDYVELSLFADDATREVLAGKVSGNLNGLKYSTIYKYDALYDSATGMIGFTRYNSGTSDDFNPYLYAPSGVANTTAAMTTQIATLAMDKMDDVVHAQGRSGGDTTKSSNAWVKVMGLNDNVEFKNFENIDSKALTVAGGYNTDKITWADKSVVFGAYAGYIGGKQQYTANDIDQDGGYIGLSSALTLGDAFLTATVNGGLLKNKANNMYGTDRFNTLWLGTGLKAGYNYAITDSVVLQPNVYGGYTLVNTKDYTSVSGVKIATNNLNFFEIDPGLKLSAVIADGWTGSVQGKYAIVMDNGADITANDIALQNISTKNYVEYGIGIDKSLTDAFYLGGQINRHDGGRTGWNGSIEFRYKF